MAAEHEPFVVTRGLASLQWWLTRRLTLKSHTVYRSGMAVSAVSAGTYPAGKAAASNLTITNEQNVLESNMVSGQDSLRDAGCYVGPSRILAAVVVVGICLGVSGVRGADSPRVAEPITEGQRVFSCGHSFHMFVPGIVTDLCQKAGIQGHVQIGVSGIGGSRVIQHWEKSDEAKEALKSGKVDVLTLSPIFLPDAGIENFATLALEHNKNIRVLVQPIWLRWDIYEPTTKRPKTVDHDAISGEELRKRHAVYFQEMDELIRGLNKKLGKTVLFIVPAPQAVIALREKIIAGQAPGLKTQSDLFTDATGHGTPPLRTLVAYCNYAVIYRRSPVGLPVPEDLKKAKLGDQEDKLNRLLQELAWEAVTQQPLSGVPLDANP
jgi:hypothetical protein